MLLRLESIVSSALEQALVGPITTLPPNKMASYQLVFFPGEILLFFDNEIGKK
jgi:hypothetical protein